MKFTIVTAVNDDEVFQKNLHSSPDISNHELIVLRGYNNVCRAYNHGMMKASNDIVLFIHQDVYLPDGFFNQLQQSLNTLPDKNWGVLGVAGVNGLKKDVDELNYLGYILNQNNVWGSPENLPSEVGTLDELLIILKNKSFLFDERIPNHHLFATDVCLQAEQQNKKNYAILAYCAHNSKTSELPVNYEESKMYIRNKWNHKLPIYNTCSIIK